MAGVGPGREQRGAGRRADTGRGRAGARLVRARHGGGRQRLRAAPADSTPAVAAGDVRLCRYGVDDWLEQSELLTGEDAAAAVAALEAGPAEGRPDVHHGPHRPEDPGDHGGRRGLGDRGRLPGLRWDGVEHDLTADVLYWVLSPGWSGGVEGDVPMPTELRQ